MSELVLPDRVTALAPASLPFQRTIAEILAALAARNYDVPGFLVEFQTAISRSQPGQPPSPKRWVASIRTTDTLIKFTIHGYAYRVVIAGHGVPAQEISISGNELLSITYSLYSGYDWPSAREAFMAEHSYGSRRSAAPFVSYRSACACSIPSNARFEALAPLLTYMSGETGPSFQGVHEHYDRLNPLLLPYVSDPKKAAGMHTGYPLEFNTLDVFNGINHWLGDHLLPLARVGEPAAESIDPFALTTPFPRSIGMLYCFGRAQDAERLQASKNHDHSGRVTSSGDHYGLRPSPAGTTYAWRGDCGNGWASIYNGGLLRTCGLVNAVSYASPLDDLVLPELPRWLEYDYVIGIEPLYADGIYIADRGVPEYARAQTLVPAAQYPENYTDPIALVARELQPEEIVYIGGPWPRATDEPPSRWWWPGRR